MHRNMPVDLVLVRHGQSEGNLAQKFARQGEVDIWTTEFRDRHNSLYRLTDTGRRQARIAGEYIRNNISPIFDKYFTSEYVRAMETAAALELPHARWATEVYLRERDRGVLANKPHQERMSQHQEEFVRKARDAFYWQPSGGESIANLCLRVDRVLQNFSENCSGLRVIVVCHGGVIKSFRALIERVRSSEYQMRDKIHNCQIVWYTRRDPKTGYIASKYNWVKSLCPWDLRLSHFTNDWREIRRHVYANVELLRSINQVIQLVNAAVEPEAPREALEHSDSSDSDGDFNGLVTKSGVNNKSVVGVENLGSFGKDPRQKKTSRMPRRTPSDDQNEEYSSAELGEKITKKNVTKKQVRKEASPRDSEILFDQHEITEKIEHLDKRRTSQETIKSTEAVLGRSVSTEYSKKPDSKSVVPASWQINFDMDSDDASSVDEPQAPECPSMKSGATANTIPSQHGSIEFTVENNLSRGGTRKQTETRKEVIKLDEPEISQTKPLKRTMEADTANASLENPPTRLPNQSRRIKNSDHPPRPPLQPPLDPKRTRARNSDGEAAEENLAADQHKRTVVTRSQLMSRKPSVAGEFGRRSKRVDEQSPREEIHRQQEESPPRREDDMRRQHGRRPTFDDNEEEHEFGENHEPVIPPGNLIHSACSVSNRHIYRPMEVRPSRLPTEMNTSDPSRRVWYPAAELNEGSSLYDAYRWVPVTTEAPFHELYMPPPRDMYFSAHASRPASYVLRGSRRSQGPPRPVNIPPLPVPYTASPPRTEAESWWSEWPRHELSDQDEPTDEDKRQLTDSFLPSPINRDQGLMRKQQQTVSQHTLLQASQGNPHTMTQSFPSFQIPPTAGSNTPTFQQSGTQYVQYAQQVKSQSGFQPQTFPYQPQPPSYRTIAANQTNAYNTNPTPTAFQPISPPRQHCAQRQQSISHVAKNKDDAERSPRLIRTKPIEQKIRAATAPRQDAKCPCPLNEEEINPSAEIAANLSASWSGDNRMDQTRADSLSSSSEANLGGRIPKLSSHGDLETFVHRNSSKSSLSSVRKSRVSAQTGLPSYPASNDLRRSSPPRRRVDEISPMSGEDKGDQSPERAFGAEGSGESADDEKGDDDEKIMSEEEEEGPPKVIRIECRSEAMLIEAGTGGCVLAEDPPTSVKQPDTSLELHNQPEEISPQSSFASLSGAEGSGVAQSCSDLENGGGSQLPRLARTSSRKKSLERNGSMQKIRSSRKKGVTSGQRRELQNE